MCKYCKTKTLNKKIGEKTNNGKMIGKINDGSLTYDVTLRRYIIERDDLKRSSLELNLMVKVDSYSYCLKSKNIEIKYCPFCGEEL